MCARGYVCVCVTYLCYEITISVFLFTGKEEYILAMEKHNSSNNIADITVMLDGGWSKRSYGHSYNAKSGVVCIF